MSKRLIRIFVAEVPARLNELSGQDLHVVLRNGQTYLGTLVTLAAGVLTLRDTRGHAHQISLPEIEEVIYDRKSPY
ncbi:hypothetical protein [Telluribacter sp.]|jgi:hypothetical protein|uniref:hypothetical protein n=1 Tax=Telluribacter sp. TaxID=1978767 RepID=UPI002E151BC6|nr:hypothetical protein [Telluribacter sp.]